MNLCNHRKLSEIHLLVIAMTTRDPRLLDESEYICYIPNNSLHAKYRCSNLDFFDNFRHNRAKPQYLKERIKT